MRMYRLIRANCRKTLILRSRPPCGYARSAPSEPPDYEDASYFIDTPDATVTNAQDRVI